MRWDAGVSMLIYTFATVAFYLLGAAVLHRDGLDPAGSQMVRTLGEMYVPVFGVWVKWLFLFGAVAVLYSTFFVASAGHTRVASDAVRVFGAGARTDSARRAWIRFFCVFWTHRRLVFGASALFRPETFVQNVFAFLLFAAGRYFRFVSRCFAYSRVGHLLF